MYISSDPTKDVSSSAQEDHELYLRYGLRIGFTGQMALSQLNGEGMDFFRTGITAKL